VPAVIGGLLDRPRLKALGAGLSAGARSLRANARLTRAGASATPLRLLAGVPVSAVAVVTGPSLASAVAAAQRAGAGGALASVRTTLKARAGLDLDRDVLARLQGEFALWLEPGAAAPVITLAARTRDPAGARVALARAQTPVARALAAQAGAKIAFQTRRIAGADAFTLPVSPAFSPTYAVMRDTVLLSTSPTGLGNFLARRPRLVAAPAFRAAMPPRPARAEGLAYADGRRLLAIAEQTGLNSAALPRIRSAGAVLARDGGDATAQLDVGLP
jgi:hypothetical protein